MNHRNPNFKILTTQLIIFYPVCLLLCSPSKDTQFQSPESTKFLFLILPPYVL